MPRHDLPATSPPDPATEHAIQPSLVASIVGSRWTVALGLLLVLAVKLVALWQLADHPLLQPRGVLDDAVYLRLAQRVASGDLAIGPGAYYLSPFYTYFLGAIFAAGGTVFAARAVQVVLGTGAVLLVGLAARRWWGARAGWIAAAAAASTGLFTFNEILLLQSSVDPFLSALALWALAAALVRPRPSAFAGAGVALGLLTTNRPNTLAAVGAVLLGWLVVRVATGNRAAGRALWPRLAAELAALSLGVALVVAPFTVRNRLVTGEWTLLTSHGGLNFAIGNHEGARGTWEPLPGISPSIEGQSADAARVASQALGRVVSAREASDYYYSLGWQWIREHPGPAALLWLRKLGLVFTATDLALNYSFTYYARDESTILSALPTGPWLLVPLGLVGLAVGVAAAGREARPGLVAWTAFLPGYAASLVIFFVASRYRLPILVMLCVGAGAAVSWLAATLAARQWRRLACAAVAVAAAAGLALWPIEADTGRSYERTERIVQLIVAGQDDEATRLLQDTEPLHPERGLLLFRAGRAWQDRGEHSKAVDALKRAVAADPGAAEIRSTLGEELLAAGRAAEAIPHLEAARDAGLDPAANGLAVARAYLSLGRLDEAVAAAGRATLAQEAEPQVVLAFAADALQQSKMAVAESVARGAVSRWPSSSAAHEVLGMALMLQDRRKDGVTELSGAVSLDPASATAHYHLALALAQAGRLAEASRLAEETLRLKPDYAEARDLLSRIGGR